MEKRLGLNLIVSLFLMVSVLGIASASLSITNVPKLSPSGNSFIITMESDINDTVTINIDSITEGSKSIIFNSTTTELVNGTPKQVTISYDTNDFEFEFKEVYSTNLTAEGTSGNSSSVTVQFESENYCGIYENKGNLQIRDIEINTLNGFGDDEDYWYLFDEIEVTVEVENEGDYDLEDVELEWVLYTSAGERIMSDDVKRRDIDKRDSEDFVFSFVLDENIEDFYKEDAILYIRAIGEIDSDDSNDEELSCVYNSEQVDIITGDDFVILNNFAVNGEELENSESIQEFYSEDVLTITADVWNIGDNDQDDVYVRVYNNKYGISKIVDIGDIDAFEDDSFMVEIEIPEITEEEEWFLINFEVYDEDDDVFENSEDDEAIFGILVKVIGDVEIEPPIVSAQLDSEAKAGEKLVILANIENIDDNEITTTLNLEGYSDWASLINVEPLIMTLGPKESQQVKIEFMVDKDAEGIQNFDLNVLSEGEILTTQPISVTLEESSFNFADFISENKKVIGIVLLNLILLILIIIIAVKILRKK
jgi:hypothetical protein